MSQLPSTDQSTRGAKPSDTPVVDPGFEAFVQTFWDKNRSTVLLACAIALLAIIGREGWEYFSARHERSVQEEYAKIADRTDKLAAFAAGNANHALAGVAYLQLADEKYSAADFKQAAGIYQQAAASLKNEALLGRAKLGAAMSQLNGGDKAGGEAALKGLSADPLLLKGIRAEAAYHLASLAYEAGKADEVKKLVGEVGKIDPSGPWSQRANVLLATSQSSGTPADSAAPTIKFKPGGE